MKKTYLFISFCLVFLIAVQATAQKHIGLATYSVKGIREDPEQAFKRIADIGFKTVEICEYSDGEIFGMKPVDFKKYLVDKGISVSSSHTGTTFDLKDEAATLSAWDKLLDDHKAMGCKYVIIPSHKWGNDLETVQANCEMFDKIGKLANEKGLTFAYHSHNSEFNTIGDSEIKYEDYIIQHTNSKYVSFEMDVYWAYQGGQDPVKWLQKYPDRIKILHIKDYYVIGASGKIDYESIFNQFYKNGNSDFYVEMENDMGIEMADEVAKWSFNSVKTNEPIPEKYMKLFLSEDNDLNKALNDISKSYQYLNSADFVR